MIQVSGKKARAAGVVWQNTICPFFYPPIMHWHMNLHTVVWQASPYLCLSIIQTRAVYLHTRTSYMMFAWQEAIARRGTYSPWTTKNVAEKTHTSLFSLFSGPAWNCSITNPPSSFVHHTGRRQYAKVHWRQGRIPATKCLNLTPTEWNSAQNVTLKQIWNSPHSHWVTSSVTPNLRRGKERQ